MDKNSKFFFLYKNDPIHGWTLGLFLYIYIKHARVGSVFVGVHISTPMAAPVRRQYWRSTADHRAGNLRRSPKRGGAMQSNRFCWCRYFLEHVYFRWCNLVGRFSANNFGSIVSWFSIYIWMKYRYVFKKKKYSFCLSLKFILFIYLKYIYIYFQIIIDTNY